MNSICYALTANIHNTSWSRAPLTIHILEWNNLVEHNPNKNKLIWPVNHLKFAKPAHDWFNHITFAVYRCSTFFFPEFDQKPVIDHFSANNNHNWKYKLQNRRPERDWHIDICLITASTKYIRHCKMACTEIRKNGEGM